MIWRMLEEGEVKWSRAVRHGQEVKDLDLVGNTLTSVWEVPPPWKHESTDLSGTSCDIRGPALVTLGDLASTPGPLTFDM